MITRLRAECSADFSNKCEAMMKDLSESENFMEDYRKIVPDHQNFVEH